MPKNVQQIVYASLGVACLFLGGVGLLLVRSSWKSDKKSGKTNLNFNDYLKVLNHSEIRK